MKIKNHTNYTHGTAEEDSEGVKRRSPREDVEQNRDCQHGIKSETTKKKKIMMKTTGPHKATTTTTKKTANSPCELTTLPKTTHLFMVLAMCLFYLVFLALENIIPFYLTTFVVMELQWPKSRGVRATFCYWLTFAITRLVCLPLSAVLTPLSLLLGSLG